MPARNRLSATGLKNLRIGKYCDGDGLWLFRRTEDRSQWIFRYTLHGNRGEIGLGGYPKVSLAQAREQAEQWREVLAEGKDPKKEKDRIAREAMKDVSTVAQMVSDTFEARKLWIGMQN